MFACFLVSLYSVASGVLVAEFFRWVLRMKQYIKILHSFDKKQASFVLSDALTHRVVNKRTFKILSFLNNKRGL